ncbi:pyrroline-5-carboxylate reductase [Siculibacillus lacustris]|uniref:Pyrroline-5-carboxylate reductase n=1 Tax=Siculibacillus lacustris TaxID=1549641 RepID=A0A4Q9VI41_9HYPH|nr:pyrroline-5-carboxylate reductase [Siculibacillus lacustris]TBW34745.1 pyrroline-5-carboxylate reductase [Siculibacillus lacustris]
MTLELSATEPLVLVGAGKMGGSLLAGWLAEGLAPEAVVVVDPAPAPETLARLAALGVRHSAVAPTDVVARVLLVAVKPQVLDAVLPPLGPLVGPRTIVISVVAGKTIATFRAALGGGLIVRTIPNTPSQVGRGITAAVAGDDVGAADRDLVGRLLAAVGRVEWVDEERLIDLVTAISGSGPAYVFHMVEALAAAGTSLGLAPDLAARLARATVEGAGELLYRSEDSPETLRRNVTSPGGTTAAALAVLMGDDALTRLMSEAAAAAAKRSKELAG